MVAAAMIGSAVVGGVASASAAKSNAKAAQAGATTTQELDPRAQAIIYGDGTDANKGLLSQYQGYLNQKPGAGVTAYGNAAQNNLVGGAGWITKELESRGSGLLNSNIGAPTAASPQTTYAAGAAGPAAYTGAAVQHFDVKAPAQNNMDLSGSYNKFINGDAGANPYLTNGLKAAEDATTAGFQSRANALSDNLQKSILPGLKSNAILSGGLGGSRQGIAEGNALSDYSRQLTDANSQLSATNNANAVNAQAQSFNAGQDRALSATQSLGAQQYGVASQNTAAQNAAHSQYANNQQQAFQQNQSMQQQNNQFNAGLQQQTGQFNAGLLQQTGLANQAAQQSTNALNSNNQLAGMAGLSGYLQGQYGVAQNQDNAALNNASQVNGLLAPYLSMNGGNSTSSPMYSNTGTNILGGATAGLSLYNGIKNAYNSNNTTTPNAQNVAPGSYPNQG